MKNKKLNLFTSSYPFGDRETYLETEIVYLSKRFHKITVYPFFYKNKNKNQRSVPSNVNIKKPIIPISKIKRVLIFIFNLIYLPKKSIFFKEFYNENVYLSRQKFTKWILSLIETVIIYNSKYSKKLKNEKNSIFYFWWGNNWSKFLFLPLKNNSNKYFVRLHGGEVFLERSNNYIPVNNKIFNSADFVLPISKLLKEYLIKNYNINQNKIKVSRLGVKNDFINNNLDEEKIRIVSISNIIPLKRINLIIDVLKNIEFKDVEWVHFGDGPQMNEIKLYAKRNLSNVSFNFFGQTSNSDVMQYFKNNPIDFVINLSSHEGLPFSLIEAMSFGIPCIATDVGATNELVNNKNGILIPKDFNIKFLAEKIVKIKKNDFYEMRKAAYKSWNTHFNADRNYFNLTKILLDE